jgi:putative ABC transport system substrate-binding protein
MRRRDLLFSGLAALSVGRTATAQTVGARHIAWLTTGDTIPRRYFEEALARLGWVEGRNLTIDRRVSGHDPAHRAAVIDQLVATRPSLIIAGGSTDALPLRAATKDIPIVVVGGSDLIEAGLVESLARPGGNVTGLTVLGRELDGKRMELVRDLMPTATRVSMLGNSNQPMTASRFEGAEAIARPLGLTIVRRMAATPADLEGVFTAAAADADQAILIPYNALTFEDRPHIISLAARLRVPAIYEFREFVAEGGLISYGAVYREYFERAAVLADKILKGAKPADLPVEQPTKFELTLNMKAAKALGLVLPQSVLARADEVIE